MRKELGNIKEPTDFEGTVKELAEQVLDLSTKQPDGMIHDADTILADIMEAADFQVSGISDDILKLYLEVENKDDFESLFYLITDEKFEDYLVESKKVMEENILKAEPRAIQVYLSDSGNDEKESIIFKTDAPKAVIENWIKSQHNSISSNYPFHHIVMELLNEGYMVKLLYDQYSKCNDVELIDQYSCEEIYHVGCSIGDIFHHMKIFNSLYYDASGVPYIKLTDSMDGSDLRKIANVLGIYSIKANEFCISKRKALICNLDFVDIMRIAEHEKYNVETGIIKNSNVQYSDQEYCLKHDGVIYEFALKNKTSGANDVLCLSKEDAKKHILKQNLLMEFRNKRFYENDCNLDQLLLMKAGYHYDPTGPMAEHWQKILEYEKDNY